MTTDTERLDDLDTGVSVALYVTDVIARYDTEKDGRVPDPRRGGGDTSLGRTGLGGAGPGRRRRTSVPEETVQAADVARVGSGAVLEPLV